MKTKLLPSLSERVDSINDDIINGKYNTDRHPFDTVFHYNRFLKKKPELYMFVPCDKEGKPMREPQQGVYGNEQYEGCEWRDYQQALDRVIFDGFEVKSTDYKTRNAEGTYTRIVNNIWDKKNNQSLDIAYYNYTSNKWVMTYMYRSIADLSGKVYLNENGIKDSGI